MTSDVDRLSKTLKSVTFALIFFCSRSQTYTLHKSQNFTWLVVYFKTHRANASLT